MNKLVNSNKKIKFHLTEKETQFTFDSIEMIRNHSGLLVTLKSKLLKKDNYKLVVKDRTLYVSLIVQDFATSVFKHAGHSFQNCFFNSSLLLPKKEFTTIAQESYVSKTLRIQLTKEQDN